MKKQDSVCFLIPLHEEKFSYGTDIISSYNKFFGCDNIFIVFSNEFESNLFLEQNRTLCYNSIIYPYLIDNAAAIKKKFFGIEYLFTNLNYEYVICIDSDAPFLRNADLLAICEKFYINKILFGNSIVKNDFMNSIICSSQRFFDKLIAEKIGKLLEDNTLYFWFNEIPIYKKDVFNRFKHKIDLNRIFQDISWYDFEYIFYGYYCLIYEDFSMIKINNHSYNNCSFLEGPFKVNPFTFLKGLFLIKPHWLTKRVPFYSKAFLLFHVDRKSKFDIILLKLLKIKNFWQW